MRYIIFILNFIAILGFFDQNTCFALDLKKPANAIPIQAGVANEVYVVNSSNCVPYVLKIFNRKTIEELQHAESLIDIVRKTGIRVPESIIKPTQVGEKVISVLSYVNGCHIDDSNLTDVAELMANLHMIEVTKSSIEPFKNLNCLFERCKDWPYCHELKQIFMSLDLSYIDKIPTGLIHGDFSYTNLLVDKDKNLTLIDFDHLRNDILLTDLARCHLFYGFTKDGQLKEDTVLSFVKAYNKIRPLKSSELDAFYTHMKLCLIDVALEMYDHMYIKRDLSIDRVEGNSFNACLNPDLIAKEILSIKDKNSIVLDIETYPIFFFGLSGVGKTTLIHLIEGSSNLFYIPKFTVTRAPRDDDDCRYFEYFSAEEFIKRKNQGEFFIWMNQEETYYGYRLENLKSLKYPLMNASPYGIDIIADLKGIKVLIEGDALKGLELRQNPKVAKERTKVNELAQKRFFSQDSFKEKMDLIYFNYFGNPIKSALTLKRQILEEMDHAN
jgi:homoserine kinase type II